ncbi:MAG: hypothetical protein GDA48_02945 [Hormoscilla sp. GM102CHS1]|nr:hypothetical protein [Hormoscilla sp. GM102CHS1]
MKTAIFTHRLTSSQASFAVVVARPDRRRTTWIAYPPDKICCSEALGMSFLTDRRIALILIIILFMKMFLLLNNSIFLDPE